MASSQRKPWSRDELIIAMNLYSKIPFGQISSRNRLIIDIAAKLERTPASISMKLGNLASFDSIHKERGVFGLTGASKLDAQIWAEFQSNWDQLALESQERFEELMGTETAETPPLSEIPFPDMETDRIGSAKQRRGHSFFSTAVKVSYHYTCCITGNPIPELLTASHIVPWKDSKTDRLNPANGLCLAKTQDSAFDEGLMTLDEYRAKRHLRSNVTKQLRVVLSKRIHDHHTLETIRDSFLKYEGKPITLPHRFRPDPKFIAYHREVVFEKHYG